MKKLYLTLGSIAIICLAAYGGSHLITQSRQQAVTPTLNIDDEQVIQRGEYIARTADCFACHTAPGGKDFAGGLAMQTPMGAIYASNITPDEKTGIGLYTLADFTNAVKHGVRKDGQALYPAMPYPSYTLMPDEDVEAMYAFFMKKVQPVSQKTPDPTLPSLLDQRWALAYWQFFFAPKRSFVADPQHDAQIQRGAYLVEGPGHCGACHTPRGFAYQEKAFNHINNDTFLSGAVIDGWRAKGLRGDGNGLGEWSAQEIIEFLKTGRTQKSFAFGAMADVIEHSTQYMSDEDLASIAYYLKTLSPSKHKAATRLTQTDTTTEALLSGSDKSRGALLYMEFCMACHRADGKGVGRIFPPLDGNTAVVAHNPQSVIQITLEGGRMAHTPHDAMAFTMPGFAYLGDENIKDIINFIRTSWTNNASLIQTQEVSDIRQFLNKKSAHYTGEQE